MSKKISIIILCIMLCFSVTCFANGQGSTHHNDVTNNYYDSSTTNNYEYNNFNDMDYNYDVDQTYNYDQSMNQITNNYISVDNSGVIENQNVQLHNDINTEAATLYNTRLTSALYYGAPIVPPGTGNFITQTKLHFNPSHVTAIIKPDSFAQFHITVTSDKPITLKVHGDNNNIKVLNQEITIDKANGTASTEVIVTFTKGVYWTYGNIIFKSLDGVELGRVRINFDNAYGIDHVSRVTMDDTYTTLGHGVRQNRGTWGWSGFVGVRVNRETNKETVYGTLTYDW